MVIVNGECYTIHVYMSILQRRAERHFKGNVKMFDAITAFFKAHEPTSVEAIVIIRQAIKLLDPAEIAELKMIVAALDQAVATPAPVAPTTTPTA